MSGGNSSETVNQTDDCSREDWLEHLEKLTEVSEDGEHDECLRLMQNWHDRWWPEKAGKRNWWEGLTPHLHSSIGDTKPVRAWRVVRALFKALQSKGVERQREIDRLADVVRTAGFRDLGNDATFLLRRSEVGDYVAVAKCCYTTMRKSRPKAAKATMRAAVARARADGEDGAGWEVVPYPGFVDTGPGDPSGPRGEGHGVLRGQSQWKGGTRQCPAMDLHEHETAVGGILRVGLEKGRRSPMLPARQGPDSYDHKGKAR